MPEELRQKLWKSWYNKLAKGIDIGYQPKIEYYDEELVLSLKKNLAEFSAFKEESFHKVLLNLLHKDKLPTWSEFKGEAQKVAELYNVNWLASEYNHTIASANMAQKWQDFERNTDTYPNLKYEAILDERVRDKHKALNGFVAPFNHPIWKRLYPPIDWGCRCDVTQTDAPVSDDLPEFNVKEEFANNPALTGKVFNSSSYEKVLSQEEIRGTKSRLNEFLKDSKLNAISKRVKIHLNADLNDLKRNLEVANIVADKTKLNILIREHIEEKGLTNPEYLINGKYLGDRKSIDKASGIIWNIDHAKKQMLNKKINPSQNPYYIVWDLDNIDDLNIDQIIRLLQRKVTESRGRKIKAMVFQYKGNVVHLTRAQIINREFEDLKVLK